METPYVRIDEDILLRNIEAMSEAVARKGLALRPHVKTHKLPRIAQLQIAAGAAGLTVATIGEAEVFAEHGARDLFIAYPLWLTPARAQRLIALARKARVSFGVDSVESAAHAGRLLGADAGRIEVLVEVDSGHHRSGTAPGDAVTVAVAARDAGLAVVGAFTFPGHSYTPGGAATAAQDEQRALRAAAAALEAAGFTGLRLSGGSTPSAELTVGDGATEVRPGVYVFGDAQQLALGRCDREAIALTVVSTVVSAHPGPDGAQHLVLDAGSKILGSDRPSWTEGFGLVHEEPAASIIALSEHHATISWPQAEPAPALGSTLWLIPNHVCLVPNLVDEVLVARATSRDERWVVAARGKNS